MAQPLQEVELPSPGFYGLNTQENSNEMPQWATKATNCVIDGSGRIAARKGWSALTTSGISAAPSVEALHEYVDKDGTATVISAASNKIYTGTTTLTSIEGSLSITDNNWKFLNINNVMVGFQDGQEPLYWTGSGSCTTLHSNISDWATGTAYSVGDIVKAVSSPDTDVFFECTTAGTSHASTEPTWPAVGSTVTDNTVTWTTRAFPKGNEALVMNGRVWAVEGNGDDTIIHYSDLLVPYDFAQTPSVSKGGVIDLKTVWRYGMDEVVAMTEHNGFLVIFGKKQIIVYQMNVTSGLPYTLQDVIGGIGCIARDSVQTVGTDILFLSSSGVRSLQRTVQEKSAPIQEISANVRDDMREIFEAETKNLIRSVYHEPEGFYILNFPTSGTSYVFDIRQRLQDGTFRVTTWDSINPKSMLSSVDGNLYLGQGGVIGQYTGHYDDGNDYDIEYHGPWLTFGSDRLKFPKKFYAIFAGGSIYDVDLKLAFDFETTFTTQTHSVSEVATTEEWGTGEWGIMEWTAAIPQQKIKHYAAGSGRAVKFGMAITISGFPFAVQKIALQVKHGRKE